MSTQLDDRLGQLVTELADVAPAPPPWSLVTQRVATRPPASIAPRRRPLALVAAGAVVLAGVGLATVALRDDSGPPGAAPSTAPPPGAEASVALGSGGGMSCVEEYDLTTLAARGFAFDGTVTAIGSSSSVDEAGGGYVEITFEVHEWFAPGGPGEVVVDMFPPGALTSVGSADYAVGSRLLVAGEPRWGGAPLDSPVAWYCGFSRTYDEPTAEQWRTAFDAAG